MKSILILLLCAASFTARSPVRVPPSSQDPARNLAQTVMPSVVQLVSMNAKGKAVSLGSGFFLRENVIVTTYQVIDTSKVYVRIVGQQENYKIVRVIAADRQKDITLFRVAGIQAPPLKIGESDAVAVGDEVYAVGNPEGFEGTVSGGRISAIRTLGDRHLFQFTAPGLSGSSGGAILNKTGEVIGVPVATARRGQNLHFAIPIADVMQLLNRAGINDKVLDNKALTISQEDREQSFRVKSERSSAKDTPAKGERQEFHSHALAEKQREIDQIINRAERQYQKAEEAYKIGKYEAARQEFDSALDILFEASVRIRNDDRLRIYYRQLIEKINRFPIASLEQKDGGSSDQSIPEPIPQGLNPSEFNSDGSAKRVDSRPVAINSPFALYTQEALNHRTEGTVKVRILVAADGSVRQIKILSGLPHGLNESAVKALSELKFKPAMKSNVPVSYWVPLDVEFKLQK